MKIRPYFFLLFLFLFLYPVSAYCNETWTMTGNVNDSYNWTVTESCSGEGRFDVGIVLFLGFLMIVSCFLAHYLKEGLDLVFILSTILIGTAGLNITANLAQSAGVTSKVVNVLWVGYIAGVILFGASILFALYALTMQLKIKKNPPPKIDSPLKMVKAQRHNKKNGNNY